MPRQFRRCARYSSDQTYPGREPNKPQRQATSAALTRGPDRETGPTRQKAESAQWGNRTQPFNIRPGEQIKAAAKQNNPSDKQSRGRALAGWDYRQPS